MKRRFISFSFQFNINDFPLLFTFLAFFLLAGLVLFPFQQGHCAQVTLTWDPNSETDLAGYEIYYGTSSGNYQWNIDVGNVTTYTVNSLNTGVTYYFAATAYNTTGLESGYSNEVVYTVSSCTYTLSPLSASFSASGGSGSVLVTTQTGCNWGTSSAPSWVTVNSGSGTGGGTMRYTVSSNSGATRSASLTIAGNVFTITEAGAQTYTITASAGSGGSISPSGGVSVQSGANQTFNITPNTGYQIASVTVDGVSQGAIASYMFSSVTANHTITASFTPISSPPAGSQTPVVSTGSDTSITLSSATLNGTVNPNGLSTTYIFQWGRTTSYGNATAAQSAGSGTTNVAATANLTGLTANRTYHYRLVATNSAETTYGTDASFTTNNQTYYTITASVGTGGSISPSGGVTVQSGASQTFTITPNSGYRIGSVTVDGVSQGAVTSYTFSAVTTNHTIVASFAPVIVTNPVRIVRTGNFYSTLQDGYNAALNNDIIQAQAQAITLTGNLYVNRDISVTLEGGYASDFSTNAGNMTSLIGMIQTLPGGGNIMIKNFLLTK
jgi:hypothetical protein